MHIAVAILRVPEGLDYSGIIANYDNDEVVQQSDVHTTIKGTENPAFISEDSASLAPIRSNKVKGIQII